MERSVLKIVVLGVIVLFAIFLSNISNISRPITTFIGLEPTTYAVNTVAICFCSFIAFAFGSSKIILEGSYNSLNKIAESFSILLFYFGIAAFILSGIFLIGKYNFIVVLIQLAVQLGIAYLIYSKKHSV